MSFKIERASLKHLQAVLPRLLSKLSIGRAQIALEHLRSHLENRPHNEILFFLAQEQRESASEATGQADASASLAAIIAIQQPSLEEAASSDVATIVHADFLVGRECSIANLPKNNIQRSESAPTDSGPTTQHLINSADQVHVIMQMRNHLDRELKDLGIRFVQWATDVTDQIERSTQQWHEGLGFKKIATLDYLSGNVHATEEVGLRSSIPQRDPEDHETQLVIELRPVSWDRAGSRRAFTKLVEATYSGTLDCPRLAQYRTTSETLRGYQTAASFAPELWFEVVDASGKTNMPLGCMILAKHEESHNNTHTTDTDRHTAQASDTPTEETESDPQPPSSSEGPVIEIVYMGLLPETRGQGVGRQLVDQAARVAFNLGGTRFILGVDRANQPARNIYNAKGMTQLLSEAIWAKQVK